MADDLQRLVDALAARLGRAAVLEDRRQRMVAYSQHGEPMDVVRRESILQRETTPEVIAWLRSFGIAESTAPVRVPGNPDLELLPRVCIPVRHADLLLGFLWFIDADGDMAEDDLVLAGGMAQDFALALYRENLLGELAQRREAEALRNLLGSDANARAHAARQLVEDGAFLPGSGVVALVVQVAGDVDDPGQVDLLRLALEQSLVRVRRRVPPRHALHLVRFDHGVLLTAAGAGTLDVAGHARQLVQSLELARAGRPHERVLVGVGEEQPGLELASRSLVQAQQAAQVATSLPGVGPVAEWRELGVYRALARLSEEEAGAGLLHPGLVALLDVDADQALARTLETYLDLAGNVQAAAAALSLHRATLYSRLRRIEEVAGADLRDGNDRLTLHLGLKLARLNGRYRAGSSS